MLKASRRRLLSAGSTMSIDANIVKPGPTCVTTTERDAPLLAASTDRPPPPSPPLPSTKVSTPLRLATSRARCETRRRCLYRCGTARSVDEQDTILSYHAQQLAPERIKRLAEIDRTVQPAFWTVASYGTYGHGRFSAKELRPCATSRAASRTR